jgi:hypothetical protein
MSLLHRCYADALRRVAPHLIGDCRKGSTNEYPRASRQYALDTPALKAIACFALIASRNEQSRENTVYFLRAPHTLDIRRILRALSRIRAELVGEFSLAIRRG